MTVVDDSGSRFTESASRVLLYTTLVGVSIWWIAHQRHPRLIVIRDYETLIICALLAIAVVCTFGLKPFWLSYSLKMLALVLIAIALYSAWHFMMLEDRLQTDPTEAEKLINKRLILGFRNFNDIARLADNGIAGIFITKRNIEGRTHDEISRELQLLQSRRQSSGLPPLIVASDQEGGAVSRMSPLVPLQHHLSRFTSRKGASREIYLYGLRQGAELRRLGINVNFSPVVDLKPDMPPDSGDRHTRIASRAISGSVEDVVAIALPYIEGLEAAGVVPTLKHFPGLGRVTADTHIRAATLETSVHELAATDWVPFIKLSKESRSWIMLSHVTLADVDPTSPVSTSSRVVSEIVRGRLGFKGKLVTDDLTMGAVYNRGFCRSVSEAYHADIDYLLLSFDSEKYVDLMQCLGSE